MPAQRIPTKKELERLQRLYKTDEKIAERLGDIPPRLVAYWRRKKAIPNYSAPKFSESEVRALWERFGDDYRCGAELGISKAAYYNWRRRYKLMEKPAFLKLEQMELFLPAKDNATRTLTDYGARPAAHKILWLKSDQKGVSVGDKITVAPDLVAIDRRALNIVCGVNADGSASPLGAVFNANRVAVGSALRAVAVSANGHNGVAPLERWMNRQLIRLAPRVADGSLWDYLLRTGSLTPGRLVACEKGMERFAGGLGAWAIGCDDKELGAVLRSGKITLAAPTVTKVVLTGRRLGPIHATDITLSLCQRINGDASPDRAVEFAGGNLTGFSIEDRQTLCGVADLLGLRGAIVPADGAVRRHLSELGEWEYQIVAPDKDAVYADSYQMNIEQVGPMVALRRSEGDSRGAEGTAVSFHNADELSQTPTTVVFIGGPEGGSADGLTQVAALLRDKKIDRSVTMIVSPWSRHDFLAVIKKGVLRQIIEAGAMVTQCGLDATALHLLGVDDTLLALTTAIEPSFALGAAPGERMVVSPLTAAASALTGRVTDPRGY